MAMGRHAAPCFDRLVPVSGRYAHLPVAQAFTWAACLPEVGPGEWYMVAFRSVRRPGADEARLTAYDDWAHEEAMQAPGFVHYFKGPAEPDGGCMSFCLWASRADARASAGGPRHVAAAMLAHEMYERYDLEFLRVQCSEPGAFTFEPWDADPAPEPSIAPAGFAPSFAPG
jgi:hypothetical protein